MKFKNYFRTNVPQLMMSLPDYPLPKGDGASVASHQQVLEYLRNFTDHFNLRKYIKVNINLLIYFSTKLVNTIVANTLRAK